MGKQTAERLVLWNTIHLQKGLDHGCSWIKVENIERQQTEEDTNDVISIIPRKNKFIKIESR